MSRHLFCVAFVFALFVGCLAAADMSLPVIETLPDGTAVMLQEEDTESVITATFSPDGKKIVTGGGDGIVRIWDAESEKELKKMEGHNDNPPNHTKYHTVHFAIFFAGWEENCFGRY